MKAHYQRAAIAALIFAIQAENKALQRLIDDQRAVNNSKTEAHQQVPTLQLSALMAAVHWRFRVICSYSRTWGAGGATGRQG